MRQYHVLNLGAGVQSTTIYLLAADGELMRDDGTEVVFDAAIFADTGDEPNAVYAHLEWMEAQGGAPISRTEVGGRLGDHLVNGTNSTGGRFASIPAYTSGGRGQARRQCTREYKVRPIEQWIRRGLLGLKPRQRVPADVQITQYMGFSTDEPQRAGNARLRFKQVRWGEADFPLFYESLWMSRNDCRRYLEGRVPHEVPRSACVFCPYKSDWEWKKLKDEDPEGWARAVEIDEKIREHDEGLYVYRGGIPLKDAKLGEDQQLLPGFERECEGGCGL